MALPETQQAASILKRATSILLAVPTKPSADAFASMLACYLALQQNGEKDVHTISPSHVPRHLQFLPGSSQVQMKPQAHPDIVIDVAGPKMIETMRQEQLNGGVRIHITFSEGSILTQDQLEMHIRQLPYDAVIVFGATDLEELGELFGNYADFFYNTPVINIDYRASNEHFGTVNLVDITASSVAEVTHELIQSLPDTSLEADMSTALYAGIVAATESFQKPSTKPQAFKLAAELMDNNADKDAVIQHLVKTKPLHLLKLLGRTYARLRYDQHGQIFWSILRPIDFQESNAQSEHISDVIHELMNNISGFNALLILHEAEANTYITHLVLGKGLRKRRQDIQQQLEAKAENGTLLFQVVATSWEEAENKALENLRNALPR